MVLIGVTNKSHTMKPIDQRKSKSMAYRAQHIILKMEKSQKQNLRRNSLPTRTLTTH